MPSHAFDAFMSAHRTQIVQSGTVIVGYSGGADSSCLLRLLQPWCSKNAVKLAAAHIHHGIRGETADRDEEFCRETCASLGIPFYSTHADVPALASAEKIGIEEAARQVRYAFFDEISEKLTGSPQGAVIATAHNVDDNLETLLFHLLRGSGLHGLCGIAPLRDGRYLRPLLRVSSTAIRTWCTENSVAYVTDETNETLDYTRNRIRRTIVPELRAIVPHPEESAARLTSLLQADDDYLESEARRVFSAHGSLPEMPRDALENLHPAILSRVLRLMYSAGRDSDATAGETHIRAAMTLLRKKNGAASLSLPGAMRYRQDRSSVWFEADSARRGEALPASASEEILFTYPADGEIFEKDGISVQFSRNDHNLHAGNGKINENIYKSSTLLSLRFDKIKGVLWIRHRQPGDLLYYGGHTHKVRRLLMDRKLTEREKQRIPIFCDDSGIVWIPGFPPRDGMAYTGEGEPLHIRCQTI